jgi:hypothetical protein
VWRNRPHTGAQNWVHETGQANTLRDTEVKERIKEVRMRKS